jgi:hypothetical protein
VPQLDAADQLMDNRQVFLILRLVLVRHAGLLYGEVLDAETIRQGQFSFPAEVADVVMRWLDRQHSRCSWPDVD